MKKDAKRKRNKREAFRTSARVLCASAALVLIASLLVVPCFALGTGTNPSVSQTQKVVYPVINDLVVTEVSAERDYPEDSSAINIYRNSFSLPLFDIDITDGKTAMQYSVDGDRVANREVSYNYDKSTKIALYERFINQPLVALGTIPDGSILEGLSIVDFEFNNVVDLSSFQGSQVEFGVYFGSTVNLAYLSNVVFEFSSSYEYYNVDLDKWQTFVWAPRVSGPLQIITNVDGNDVLGDTFYLDSVVLDERGHNVIRNFKLTINAKFYELRPNPTVAEPFELTLQEVRERGIYVSGISVQMPYTDEPINNSEVVVTAPPVYFADDFNILSWVVDVVTSFLDVPLFTTVSGLSVITIGSLIGLVVTFGFVFVILKFFYGG